MKPTLYKLLPAILLMALQEGCQPVVEKPAIENCLIKKIDQIEIISTNLNGQNSPPVINSSSTSFLYDASNRPTTFSYFQLLTLTGYTKVTYKPDGTLASGIDYDSFNKLSGTKEYQYNTNKQLTVQSSYDTDHSITDFTSYEYNPQGMVSLATTLQTEGAMATTFSYRNEYDTKNNVIKQYQKYLSRIFTGTTTAEATAFLNTLLADLKKEKEVLVTSLSDYDDKFNPYRSQATLAILFDNLPAFNNPKTLSNYYRDTGTKYVDITYKYEYNRKGFPYIYTIAVDYTAEYTSRTGIQDYTSTSSYEYQCK